MIKRNDEYFMQIALSEARKALESEDVPVGAVIVSNGKIISRAYNQVEKKNNALAHAELLAIDKAIKKIGYKHLLDCEIYTTLEPCPMCAGAIVLTRLKRLIFAATDPKSGASSSVLNITNNPSLNHRVEVSSGVLADESSELLKWFFQYIRNQI
jgi:tRNA(adenine34) deaminase